MNKGITLYGGAVQGAMESAGTLSFDGEGAAKADGSGDLGAGRDGVPGRGPQAGVRGAGVGQQW
ncbi:hypothetical protein JIX56_32255 [Streptomyces sp. CA-210063]|uniref:hypothetical protein n=1 Tax=Streptomyces sp. CA-210063 TaxID=2801029 RepID=UPI00214B56F1|nr:hypothetical protein [Streptomyces sp. CA-210063]UUU34139.1 hypothetical protein JIX56_32255 [Streptomyces sp. CA-210063]